MPGSEARARFLQGASRARGGGRSELKVDQTALAPPHLDAGRVEIYTQPYEEELSPDDIEFFLEREAAEAMIGEVQEDEPALAEDLRVEAIELG